MTLLTLESVNRRNGRAPHERVALRDVTLELDSGELVAVWGKRRSGRSTLLRVAAGIEPPDTGVVRFQGSDLSARSGEALGHGIGYCKRTLPRGEGRFVLDKLMVGPRIRGHSHSQAKARAHAALDRTGASECAGRAPGELDDVEAVRVSLARALVLEPALLLLDEPVTGVELQERDDVLALLRSLADEGIAVLITVAESLDFSGANRRLSISAGVLRGEVRPELASVHHLRREVTA
jgi:ABC-type sugar transport system ATPase subunit